MELLVLVGKWWNQLSLGYEDISALELEFLKFDTMQVLKYLDSDF